MNTSYLFRVVKILTSDSYGPGKRTVSENTTCSRRISSPLRFRIVDDALDTTTGPLSGPGAPQFRGIGFMPICLGYVLGSRSASYTRLNL